MKLPRSAYISSFNDVTEASLRKYSPVILSKLKDATHVAIDLEFTSLCRSRQKDMNHRYVSMKRVIEKGSMLSLGLSIFGKNSKANSLPKIEGVSQSAGGRPPFAESYVCDNFNFLTKKKIPYFMDTDTKEFLIKHGFQFDRLKKEGIPFMPPSTPVNHPPVQTPSITDTCTLQSVWSQITAELANNNIPLVVHNGLHDLIYIYNSLISPLPERWAEFVTRLPTHFPGGIYDTKHLVNNGPFGGVSFLPYVFGKSDRDRQDRFINSTKIKPYFEVLVNPAIDDAKIDVISTEEITTLADSHSSTKRKSSVDLEKTEIRKRKPDYCYEYAVRAFNCNTLVSKIILTTFSTNRNMVIVNIKISKMLNMIFR